MKKLMLLVAVAGLAFAGQAACLDWKYTAAAADVGKTVYVMQGDTPQTSWANIAAIEAAALDSATVAKSGRNYFAVGTVDAASVTKSSANIYYVVVSADKSTFDVSNVSDMKGSVYDPAAQESGSGANESISSSSTFAATGQSFSGGTPVVPEPTSGILMLVGLGALALRRRKA